MLDGTCAHGLQLGPCEVGASVEGVPDEGQRAAPAVERAHELLASLLNDRAGVGLKRPLATPARESNQSEQHAADEEADEAGQQQASMASDGQPREPLLCTRPPEHQIILVLHQR